MKQLSNKRILPQILISIGLLLLQLAGHSQSGTPVKTGYAPVNGLKMYYEIYGEGKPLVLLHGAFMTIYTNYGMLIPELAKTRKVIAVEFQGHGRTADIDRPFSIENFADDVAALLKSLRIDSADVLGYSLGGMVALNVAIRHPGLVKKLVLASSVFKFEGWSPETRAAFPMIKPEFFEHTPIKTAYDSLAPDPKHWPVFIGKMMKLVTISYDYTAGAKKLKLPIFFIMGDSDGILPEYIAEMYRIAGGGQNGDMAGVPNSRLAILPATPHTGLFIHNDWLASMIPDFLDAPVK